MLAAPPEQPHSALGLRKFGLDFLDFRPFGLAPMKSPGHVLALLDHTCYHTKCRRSIVKPFGRNYGDLPENMTPRAPAFTVTQDFLFYLFFSAIAPEDEK